MNMDTQSDKLIDIDLHCHYIYEFFLYDSDFYPDEAIAGIMDLLSIASGIESIEINLRKYDRSLLFCDMERVYNKDQCKYHEIMIRPMIKFLYIWTAVEKLIDLINPVNEKKGKVAKIIKYVEDKFNSTDSLPHHDELMVSLDGMITEIRTHTNEDQDKFEDKIKKYAGKSLMEKTWRYVYEIRNHYVHGAISYSGQSESTAKSYKDIFDVSSRLTLFLIQYLMMFYRGKDPYAFAEFGEDTGDGIFFGIFFSRSLRNIHVVSDDTNSIKQGDKYAREMVR